MDAQTTEVTSREIQRINLLKAPLDILPPESLSEVIYSLLSDGGEGDKRKGRDIVLLSLMDLLKVRRNPEYRAFVTEAALVIPISKSLAGGAKFLTGKTPPRYMPFNFVVSILTILEKREFTIYLLGGKRHTLRKAEKNIRQTFPKLRVVGRYPGAFRRQDEKTIVEAIRKAAPSLLLVGKGVRGGEFWIARNGAALGGGLRLWCSDLFSVFADQKRRPSDAVFDRGLEWIGLCLRNPLRVFRFFPYMYYKFLLLAAKLAKKRKG